MKPRTQIPALLLSGLALLALALPAGALASGPTWSQAEEISAPFFGPFEVGQVTSAACRSAGDCVAVGYTSLPGQRKAFAVTEIAGLWTTPVRIEPPPGAAPAPDSYLQSVACSPATCFAVGGYTDNSEAGQPMVVSETAGAWGAATQLARPAEAEASQYVNLETVACPASGPCLAVGHVCPQATYTACAALPPTEHDSTFQIGESEGVWGSPSTISVPPDTSWSLACPSAEHCLMAGSPLAAVQQAGAGWSAPMELMAPENLLQTERTSPGLSALACQTSCYAAGNYVTGSLGLEDAQGFTSTESAGLWSKGQQTSLPPNASSEEAFVHLASLACPASGPCAAVGSFEDSLGDSHAMFVAGTSGLWEAGVEVLPPANARSVASGSPNDGLTAAACPPAGACVALGYYVDANGESQVMATTETSPGEEEAKEEEKPKPEEEHPKTDEPKPEEKARVEVKPSGTTAVTETTPPPAEGEESPVVSPLTLPASTTVECSKGGSCTYTVTCKAGGPTCSGTVTLGGPAPAGTTSKIIYGKVSFTVAAGHKSKLTIRLGAAAKRLLTKHRKLRAQLVLLAKRSGRTIHIARSVTLKPARRHH
jgi:hypothetical protein